MSDAQRLGLSHGDPVTLRSEIGMVSGRCHIAPMKERNLQMFWPEANPLIPRGVVEAQCGIPDFSAVVEVVSRPLGEEAE